MSPPGKLHREILMTIFFVTQISPMVVFLQGGQQFWEFPMLKIGKSIHGSIPKLKNWFFVSQNWDLRGKGYRLTRE